MKLERRGDMGVPASGKDPSSDSGGKKPVIVYIFVLFIVAFLLMALSLLVHQRSNAEDLGQLQSSATIMQEVQDLQEQVIQLQKELAEAREKIAQLEDGTEQVKADLDRSEKTAQAYLLLTSLADSYARGQYDACRSAIDAIEAGGYDALFAVSAGEGDSPASFYQTLKEAVEALEG